MCVNENSRHTLFIGLQLLMRDEDLLWGVWPGCEGSKHTQLPCSLSQSIRVLLGNEIIWLTLEQMKPVIYAAPKTPPNCHQTASHLCHSKHDCSSDIMSIKSITSYYRFSVRWPLGSPQTSLGLCLPFILHQKTWSIILSSTNIT